MLNRSHVKTIQTKQDRLMKMIKNHHTVMVSQHKTLKDKNEKFVKEFLDILMEEPEPIKVIVVRPEDEDKLEDFIDHA